VQRLFAKPKFVKTRPELELLLLWTFLVLVSKQTLSENIDLKKMILKDEKITVIKKTFDA